MSKKVIVVGAGIIGASVAYHLARAGAEVIVVEAKAAAGGVATPNTWAWINASWGNPEPYVKLRMAAMARWRELGSVHDGLRVNWCGGLLWDLPEAELTAYAKQQAQWGYDVRLIAATEAQRLEPLLAKPPEVAAYAAGEGMIEHAAAVRGFMDAALQLGASFLPAKKVQRLVMMSGRVTGVDIGTAIITADDVVLATGAETARHLAAIDIHLQMDAPAGLLAHSQIVPRLLQGLIMAPEIHVRQTAEGRLVVGSDFSGTQPGADPAATAREIFAKLKQLLNNVDHITMEYFTVGHRPTPQDGFPAVGRLRGVEGLYVVVTHSGITLAPAMGAFSTHEIMTGEREALLAPYDPMRLVMV